MTKDYTLANSPAFSENQAHLVAKAHQPAGVGVDVGVGSEGLAACSRQAIRIRVPVQASGAERWECARSPACPLKRKHLPSGNTWNTSTLETNPSPLHDTPTIPDQLFWQLPLQSTDSPNQLLWQCFAAHSPAEPLSSGSGFRTPARHQPKPAARKSSLCCTYQPETAPPAAPWPCPAAAGAARPWRP